MENSAANPELIRLARQSRGYTQKQLLGAANIVQSRYSRLEAGSGAVSETELASIAGVLDYPPHFFTRNVVLRGPGPDGTFHRKRQAVSKTKLEQAYSLAEVRRLEIQKLLAWDGATDEASGQIPEYPIELYDDDPAKIARSARVAMEVPAGPVYSMTRTLEHAGAVVVAHDFGTRQIDGFSHRLNPLYPPVFHINRELPPDRWRWTLAHELGHIVMSHDPAGSRQLIEAQANEFAGEFLAPGHEIMPMLFGLNLNKLAGLKLEWKISMQAIVERGFALGVITEVQRRRMHIQLSKAGYKTREPESLDPPLEPPERLFNLAKLHMTALEYSRDEMLELLAINATDFQEYYHDPQDMLSLNSNVEDEWRLN